MDGVLTVALGWLIFGGSHVVLATAPIRRRLEARLGRRGFPWLFTVVAAVTFTPLCVAYARAMAAGPPGLALAHVAGAREVLVTAVVAGIVLMVGALAPASYFDSPTAILVEGVRAPRGLDRVSRHPFFAGLVIYAGAHALLATRLVGTVFFAGFVGLAVLGSLHQAGKLRARHGDAYDRYLAQTSAVPFLAILRGEQRLALRELPWLSLALGLLAAFALRHVHHGVMAGQGTLFAGTIVGGAVLIGLVASRRDDARRARRSPDQSAPA